MEPDVGWLDLDHDLHAPEVIGDDLRERSAEAAEPFPTTSGCVPEYIAGAEEEWRRRTGRPMTAEELERVLRRYPGDL